MDQDTEKEIQAIEGKLTDVLWSLRHVLPKADTKDIQSLINQNDLISALETLVCILCEDEVPVPSEDLHRLQWLSKIMQLSDTMGMVKNLRVEFT